jgi:hypothetical protein
MSLELGEGTFFKGSHEPASDIHALAEIGSLQQ